MTPKEWVKAVGNSGASPTRWPMAAGALLAFTAALGGAVADDDVKAVVYTLIVVGAALIGAWIYALGAHDYSGESLEVDFREPDEAVPDLDRPVPPQLGRGEGAPRPEGRTERSGPDGVDDVREDRP